MAYKNPYAFGAPYYKFFLRTIRESLGNFDDLEPEDRLRYRQGVAARTHDPYYTEASIPTRRKNRHPPLVRVLTR